MDTDMRSRTVRFGVSCLSCFVIYALTVVVGLYALVRTLSGFYLVHLGNAVTMIYMSQEKRLLLRLVYPVVSFAAYALVRTWTKSWNFIAIVGSFNLVEQCIGGFILIKLLRPEDKKHLNLRLLSVVVGISTLVSLALSAPASYILSRMNHTRYVHSLLPYIFSHVAGNYFCLYFYYVFKNSALSWPTFTFYRDLSAVCLCTGLLHCLKQYGSFATPVIVLTIPLMAFIAIRYSQRDLVIAEMGMIIIIVVSTMLDHGPYVYQYDGTKRESLFIVMPLYSILITSSILCAVLCIVIQQRSDALHNVMQLKDDILFLSSQVSHDIRAPIMHVTDMCRSVKAGSCSNEQIQDAQASCESIMEMMDSWLLMLRSSEESALILKKNDVPVETRAFLQRIVSYGNRMLPRMHKDLVIILLGAEAVPEHLCMDERLLYHIIINLVSNSIKYTDSGEIRISVLHSTASQDLTISVEDTGRGIAETDLTNIFERYFRVQSSTHRAAQSDTSTTGVQNHGVGLSIVRRLTDALNGVVTVKSTLHEGTTFTVVIPVQLAEAPRPILNTLRVCIAEDDRACKLIFAKMLKDCALVEVVDDGNEVMAILTKTIPPFDVLCLDGTLPGTSGREILELMHKSGKFKSTGIVTISGGEMVTPSTLRIVACPKPFNGEKLRRAVIQAYTEASEA
jgi:signal transduction histidine kinase